MRPPGRPAAASAQGDAPVPGAMGFFKNARRRDVGAGAKDAPASMLAVAAPGLPGAGEEEAGAELDPVEAAKLAALGRLPAYAQARLRDARRGAVEELPPEEERRRREELGRQEAERAAELEELERQSLLEEKMSGVRAMTRGVHW
ncbi:unnamed protein product [Prorocentrum cordatum]|uniref:Uncharacterized protein n=1 Tax=Prorocentrum cordatum TaxID=2364126 RepID=A0ABN9PU60_9DINO|nr:unnamed protein product [Polarella glacialis]